MSAEQQLRDLFAADAAGAPEVVELAAGARHRVRRRRRVLAAWTSGAGTAVVLATVGLWGAYRPMPPQGPVLPPQVPAVAAVVPSPSQRTFTAEPFDRIVPGGPLVDAAMASCVGYSPTRLADDLMVFDGTVLSIGPGRTNLLPATGVSARRAVTFRVHEWLRGGPGDTVIVDLPQPRRVDPRLDLLIRPSYRVGTRLLVSSTSRIGGVPPAYPIAATCGYTRYYSPERAAEWAAATG